MRRKRTNKNRKKVTRNVKRPINIPNESGLFFFNSKTNRKNDDFGWRRIYRNKQTTPNKWINLLSVQIKRRYKRSALLQYRYYFCFSLVLRLGVIVTHSKKCKRPLTVCLPVAVHFTTTSCNMGSTSLQSTWHDRLYENAFSKNGSPLCIRIRTDESYDSGATATIFVAASHLFIYGTVGNATLWTRWTPQNVLAGRTWYPFPAMIGGHTASPHLFVVAEPVMKNETEPMIASSCQSSHSSLFLPRHLR